MKDKENKEVEPLITFNIGIDKKFKKEVTDYLKGIKGISLSMLAADGLEKEFKELKANLGSFKSLRNDDFIYAQTNICLDKTLKKEVSEYLKEFTGVSLSDLAETGLRKEFELLKSNNGIHKAKNERLLNKDLENFEKSNDNLMNVAIKFADIGEKVTTSNIVVLGKEALRFKTAADGLEKKLKIAFEGSLVANKKETKLDKAKKNLIIVARCLSNIDKDISAVTIVELSKDAVKFNKAYVLAKGV